MSDEPAPRLELSLPKILAGALAAASAAVASSWLGVAGTVFGAVVVSVVATVGTALYSHSLERSRHAIKETLPALASRSHPVRGLDDDADTADNGPETLEISAVTADLVRQPVNWATVLVSCVATLVLGLGVLTGFEALTGKSAAELTGSSSPGGTTLGSIVEGGGSGNQREPARPSKPTVTQPTDTSPTTSSPTTTAPVTTAPTSPTTTSPTTTSPTSPTTTSPTSPTTTSPTSTSPTSPTTSSPAHTPNS